MPWQLSYAALAESDNAELQTDVMRFMAILAFCLVAIFAIVQSIPPTTATDAPPPAAAISAPAEPGLVAGQPELASTSPVMAIAAPVAALAHAALPADEPASAPPAGAVVRAAQPVDEPVTRPIVLQRSARVVAAEQARTIVLQRPPPASRANAAEPQHRVAPSATPGAVAKPPGNPDPAPTVAETPVEALPSPVADNTRNGLSLRFESDAVLRRLVSRGLIGLYAIDGTDFYAMALDGSRVHFVAAAAPVQYHEMVADTVPADVKSSFRRQQRVTSQGPVWGVTLPAATTQQLQRFIRTNFSGGLVITADAGLALARS